MKLPEGVLAVFAIAQVVALRHARTSRARPEDKFMRH
jgi:hypothetical protein